MSNKKLSFYGHIRKQVPFFLNKKTHAIFDRDTGRILFLTNYIDTVNAFKYFANTSHLYNIRKKVRAMPPNSSLTANRAYNFSLDLSQGGLKETDNQIIETKVKNMAEQKKFRILRNKAALLDLVYSHISSIRAAMFGSVYGQQIVYVLKHIEAIHVLRTSQDDKLSSEPWSFPFLNSYANLKKISLEQAAREVQIKADISITKLAENEELRLKYTALIVQAGTTQELLDIYYQFEKEFKLYGQL